LKDYSAVVISDEIYREIYFHDRPQSIRAYYPNTVVTVLHQYVNTCASTLTQHAALEAFTDEGRAAQEGLRNALLGRRNLMIDLVDSELHCRKVIPDGTFYMMVDISDYAGSLEVAERLLEYNVITIPGSAFGRQAEGYLRLSFATDFEKIREGILRIKSCFREAIRG